MFKNFAVVGIEPTRLVAGAYETPEMPFLTHRILSCQVGLEPTTKSLEDSFSSIEILALVWTR